MKDLMKLFGLKNTRQATLPDEVENREKVILGMSEGESGWTVPWAMYADKQGRMWLNGNYSLKDSPGGTVQLKVAKDDLGQIIVDASRCKDHSWKRGDPCFMGDFTPILVNEVIW